MRLYLALFIWSLSACCLAEPMHAFKAVHADGTIGYSDTWPESASSVEKMNVPQTNPAIEQQGQQRMQELDAVTKLNEEQQAEQSKTRQAYQDRLAEAQKWVRETEQNLARARQSKKNATPEYIGNWEERVRLARQHLRNVQSAGP